MEFDLAGRLDNMRMPDGRTAILFAVYEAVSNSIHAIEDRFGNQQISSKGEVDVEIATEAESGHIESIVVRDNGIGLTRANLDAFNTCDSRNKKARGGKGIGRLVWLKLFRSIKVRSTFEDAHRHIKTVAFQFVPNQKVSLKSLSTKTGDRSQIGTEITFTDIQPDHNAKMRRATFVRDLALHFFSYFMSENMPTLTVHFNQTDPLELREYIRERIDTPMTETLALPALGKDATVEIAHLYVDRTISRELRNSLLLVAHNRQVEKIEIERKFALNQLLEGKAYIALVRGAFLDDRVDQERTGFKLTLEQLDIIHDAVLQRAEVFLHQHIAGLREVQRTVVTQLLAEHPQLAIKVRNVDEYVKTLSPSMGDEEIGRTVFTLLYRDERKIAQQVRQITETADLSEQARSDAQETLSRITEQAKVRLAEYVVKRRQILDLAKRFLRYEPVEGQKYHYEKAIHDLICPMGKFFEAKDYAAHNLWVIDDLLAYYSFFASDKQMRTFAPESKESLEPDLIFVNPMGFRRQGTNDPVVLVEFKRPGDEQPSGDPVNQVLTYIEKLRGNTVRHLVDGEVISEIRERTPFECFIVCDLTEGMRRLLDRSIASYETPDGEGYYGFAPKHRATIHVVSYSKMLRDAELRNRVFFDQLGLVI